MLGVGLAGRPLQVYLEFPPRTLYIRHAPFSWSAFIGICLFVLLVVSPYVIRGFAHQKEKGPTRRHPLPFPRWGWAGIVFGLTSWIMAWTRFPWFSAFQPHTFIPLWLSYILFMNALCHARTGHCLLLDSPLRYLLLFPVSSAFWWFFEYLNRFVQNWYYPGVFYSALEYFSFASLSFSTVLPAFTATREWILSFSWPHEKFSRFLPISVRQPRPTAWAVLLLSGIGLASIGVFPGFLYPILWISPLLIFVSLQTLTGEGHLFSTANLGDWTLIVASAVAAIQCGFFWEMWNFWSLAKWRYQVPLVDRFHIFEMPILGYAGYIPFGLECAVIADAVLRKRYRRQSLQQAGPGKGARILSSGPS